MPQDPLGNPAPLIRRVYAYVAYRMGDVPDAEDVTSEVFERALRYRGSYDRSKGDPASWLIGIARRCVDGALASRQPRESVSGREAEIGDLEAKTIARLALHEALEALDGRDRELIALRYGADLSARQIAGQLGMRTNAVEVALHRALARLRAALGEDVGRLDATKAPFDVSRRL
jgi:RNA polymerase sigma-70 factor (ECF subfamily)